MRLSEFDWNASSARSSRKTENRCDYFHGCATRCHRSASPLFSVEQQFATKARGTCHFMFTAWRHDGEKQTESGEDAPRKKKLRKIMIWSGRLDCLLSVPTGARG